MLEFKVSKINLMTSLMLPKNYSEPSLKEDKELPLVQITALVGAGGITIPKEKTGFSGLFGNTWACVFRGRLLSRLLFVYVVWRA